MLNSDVISLIGKVLLVAFFAFVVTLFLGLSFAGKDKFQQTGCELAVPGYEVTYHSASGLCIIGAPK